jgi:PAS domain S-box-containing protein
VVIHISAPGGGRRAERRRPKPPDQLPIEALQEMPALVVLERLPAPAMAVDPVGNILFANSSFCEMVGHTADEVLTMNVVDISRGRVTAACQVDLALISGGQLVELRHKHGHSVWATMSKSAMLRRDDTVALVTFCDRTEELWLNSATRALPG